MDDDGFWARGKGRERGNVLVNIFKTPVAQRAGGITLRCMSAHPTGWLNGHVIIPIMQTDFDRALTCKYGSKSVRPFAT